MAEQHWRRAAIAEPGTHCIYHANDRGAGPYDQGLVRNPSIYERRVLLCKGQVRSLPPMKLWYSVCMRKGLTPALIICKSEHHWQAIEATRMTRGCNLNSLTTSPTTRLSYCSGSLDISKPNSCGRVYADISAFIDHSRHQSL
jgi:hypothetical protein